MKDGEPEYAILPYQEYQRLLQAARQQQVTPASNPTPPPQPERVAVQAQPAKPAVKSEQPAPIVDELRETEKPGYSGKKAASIREQKNLDLKMVARGIGISPAYLAQIEAGERNPGEAIWRNIARELHVDQDDLKGAE